MGNGKKVALGGNQPDPVEVDLWGAEYTLRASTRDVLKKSQPVEDEIDKLIESGSDDPDDLVDLFARMFDLRLAPQNGAGKASTHINKQWKANAVTIDELIDFAQGLAEASRPT